MDMPSLRRRFGRSLIVVAALLLLSLVAVQVSVAQTPCPADKGCAQMSLIPGTAVGDFYLGDQLLAAGQNNYAANTT